MYFSDEGNTKKIRKKCESLYGVEGYSKSITYTRVNFKTKNVILYV